MDGSKLDGKTVAEHIVDFLERREVKHVFGLCGHTNIAVLAALAESPIEFVTGSEVATQTSPDRQPPANVKYRKIL